MITDNDVTKHLSTKIFGKKFYFLDTVDSTNTYAKRLVLQGAEEGTVVSTEHQYAGRGRFNRKWVSAPGKNLTFSVIIRPAIDPQSLGILSLFAGLSVAQAVAEISPVSPICKWPNDVLLDGKKLCGILSESVFEKARPTEQSFGQARPTEQSFGRARLSAVIIGIGLNINQVDFPAPLDCSATSLAKTCQREFDRGLVLARVLGRLEHLYQYVLGGRMDEIVNQSRLNSTMVDKEIILHQPGVILRGIVKRIDGDGGLIISCDGAERKIFAGDITMGEEREI